MANQKVQLEKSKEDISRSDTIQDILDKFPGKNQSKNRAPVAAPPPVIFLSKEISSR